MPKIGNFVREYSRKRQKGVEPNDRVYDRSIEKLVKRMDPVDLSKVLTGEEEEE